MIKQDPPKLAGILKNTAYQPEQEAPKTQIQKTDSSNSVLITVPSDGGYAWMAVLAGFCINFMVDGVMLSLGKMIPNMKKHFNTTTINVAFVFSLMHATYYIISPFAGAFINRFGFRIIGALGAVTSCACIYGSTVMDNIYLVMLLHAIAGIGFSMLTSSSIICINLHFDKQRSCATLICTCGSAFGIFALEPIISYYFLKHNYEVDLYWIEFMQCESYLLIGNIFFMLICTAPKSIKLKVIKREELDDDSESSESSDSISSSEDELSSMVVIRYLDRSSLSLGQRVSAHQESAPLSTRKVTFNPFPTLAEFVEVPPTRSNFSNIRARLRNPFENWQSRPLYKDDILFDRNLSIVPYVQKHVSTTELKTHAVGTRVSTQLLLTRIPPKNKMNRLDHIRNALKISFDPTLINSLTFLVILLSGAIFFFANFIPFAFVTANAMASGIRAEDAMWLVSIIGISSIFGRLFVGCLLLLPNLNIPIFTGIALILIGAYTIFYAFFISSNFLFSIFFCVIHGASNSIQFAFRPIIYVQTFGLEQLTNAYGLSSVVKGIFLLIGTPLLGLIQDITDSWVWVFFASGIFVILSGLLMSFLPAVKKREDQKNATKFGVDAFEAVEA